MATASHSHDDEGLFTPEELALLKTLPKPDEKLNADDLNRRAVEDFIMEHA